LLLEVARLRGLLVESSEVQAHEVARLKQGYEDSNYLQMSSFRQREHSQVELYEFQIRKMKEQLLEKAEEQGRLEVQLERERKGHEQEKESLGEEVRLLISKKNAEICDLQQ
jgi:predicted lipase